MKHCTAIPKLKELRCFLLFVCIVIFAVTFLSSANAQADDMVFKHVAFKNASIKQVINFLRKHLTLNVVLRLSKTEKKSLPPITFNFRYVPPAVVIKYACLASGLNYYYENDVLIIGKNLKIPFKYYPSDFKGRSILADIPIGSGLSIGTTYYVPFPVGQPRVATDGNTTTVVSAPVKWVKFQEGVMLGDITKKQKEEKRKPRKRKRYGRPKQPTGIVIASNSYLMRRRLEYISIPKLELDEVPVAQAVEILRKLSIKYDRTKRGINFFLIPFPGMDDATVTLSLERMSLESVIRLVFTSAGIKPLFGHYVVVGTKGGLSEKK